MKNIKKKDKMKGKGITDRDDGANSVSIRQVAVNTLNGKKNRRDSIWTDPKRRKE